MKSNISAILGIVVAVNFLFGLTLLIIQLAQKKKGLEYIYINFFLKAGFFLAPALVMFNIDMAWGAWITGPIKVTMIPVIYLYFVKLDLSDKRLKKKDLWHFTPLLLDVILTLFIVPEYLEFTRQQAALEVNDALTMVWKNNNYLTIMAITARSISLAQAIIYFFLILKKLKIYSGLLRNVTSIESYLNLRWLRWAAILIITLGVAEGIALVGAYNVPGIFQLVLLIQFIYVIFFFIHSILHRDLFAVAIKSGKQQESPKDRPINKPESDQIILKFIEEEIFLDPKLDLQTASKKLEIPQYRFSQLIKENGYKNFYDFVNFYRIEKSKSLLMTLPDNIIIEAIGYDSGFNSRATFFRVFKSFTGTSPLLYKKIK